jgi:multidrug efflux pump subunit AcrA (membrane-fusion protein)
MTDAQLAEAAEKHTQIETRVVELRAQLRANRERWVLALAAAAATVGQPPEALAGAEDSPLHWRRIAVLEVRARAAGVVEHIALASGSWVDAHALVLTSVDPTAVRARAQALQSDLPRLRDELPTALVPAGAGSPTARVAARLQLAPSGDPRRRTLEVHATPTAAAAFVRPGAAVYIEITTLGSEQPVLAIPRSAVLQDGLQRVYFRRDPKDPDRVIRVEADLGLDDGRWIEVKSDLTDGDQVVITGAYELVLATAGQANKGGHFHADGTWHEDHE